MGVENEENQPEDAEKFKFPEENLEDDKKEREDLGGYSPEQFDAMKDNPETAEHAHGIILQREHLQEVERKNRDRAWLEKYPEYAQTSEGSKLERFLKLKTHETIWYDVVASLESKQAPQDLLGAALEHPSHFVPRAAAMNYRLQPEQLAIILSREDIPEWNIKECLEAQTSQGMTPEELQEAQQLADAERSRKTSK